MVSQSGRPTSWRGVAIRLFATCWLVYVLHFATNSVREVFPALSLGDHLSFDVSEYAGLHPDIFELPGRGAFINNNPGASILGAIPYTLARPIIDRVVQRVQEARAVAPNSPVEYDSIYPMAQAFYREARGRGLDVKLGLGAGAMQALLMAPISALSVVVMFRVLLYRITSMRTAALLALLYAFATPVLYRTAQLNHNLLLAHFAFFAFVLLWRPWDAPAQPRRPRYFLAGLLAGWPVVLDYTGLVVVLSLGLYALVRYLSMPPAVRSVAGLCRFALGAGAAIGVLLVYQWLAFGNPFYPAQHYMPPTALSGYGVNGMGWPQLDLLWDTTFGLQFGLFPFAPILLLALWVPGWLRGRARLVGGAEIVCIGCISLGLLVFASATEFGRLQFNSGVRYVVPAVPFLFLLGAGVLRRMPPLAAVAIGIVTTYWSWCLAMYRDVEQGSGVLESLIHITREGPRLPWLTTLEHLGYVSHLWTFPILAVAVLGVCAIWLPFLRGVASRKLVPLTAGARRRSVPDLH